MEAAPNHKQYNDREFLEALENMTISPELFTHEAHLRMAWLYIRQNSKKQAMQKISAAIRGLDNKYSAGKNYHYTKTVAFAQIIGHMIKNDPCGNWQDFFLTHADLFFSKKTLEIYYSNQLINSVIAGKEFIEPDICPLPDF